jgi:hypothetical protein
MEGQLRWSYRLLPTTVIITMFVVAAVLVLHMQLPYFPPPFYHLVHEAGRNISTVNLGQRYHVVSDAPTATFDHGVRENMPSAGWCSNNGTVSTSLDRRRSTWPRLQSEHKHDLVKPDVEQLAHAQESCLWLEGFKGISRGTHGGNRKQLRPFPLGEICTGPKSRCSSPSGPKPWGQQVLNDSQAGVIDASYLGRFLPGCFVAPHPDNAIERDLQKILGDAAALARLDKVARSAQDYVRVTDQLNALRLTMRNKGVQVRHTSDRHVAMLLTSTTLDMKVIVDLLADMSQKVKFAEEMHLFVVLQAIGNADMDGQFVPSSCLRQLFKCASWIRHVSIYFAPVTKCHNLAMARQPNMNELFQHRLANKRELNQPLKSFSINMHWIWANNLVMNHLPNRYDYVVTLEDDMVYHSDFYLFHLSLQDEAVRNPLINAISPLPLSSWYTCASIDFKQHMAGNWGYSSYTQGVGLGIADVQALVVEDSVMPFGCGYTRRFAMAVAALYVGVDLSFLHTRYDVFGTKWATSLFGRYTLTPISTRADGDPTQRTLWDWGFPHFLSCNHSTYYVVNPDEAPLLFPATGTKAAHLATHGMVVYDGALLSEHASRG